MSDVLEDFVLNKPNHVVNTWMAENVMGWEAVSLGTRGSPNWWVDRSKNPPKPMYRIDGFKPATDRTLPYVIEDRIRDLQIESDYGCMLMLYVHDKDHLCDQIWDAINITLRERILAAARAMELKAPA